MAINPTNHTVYQLNGITAFSNDPAVNTRSVDSGHLVIDASASANMLTIEGVTYAYNKQSVNNVLDTQFNYFKFPVQVVYSPIDINIDIEVPEPEESEKPDPIFARYKPSESIDLSTENWNPIELSDIEDGNAQKKPNRYYINKAIKDENKPLRFRFNWDITVEKLPSNDTVIAQIGLLQESPNRTLWHKGYFPGWTTGYEWPDKPPDTVPGIKNWGHVIDATLTTGLNTGSLDITVPSWAYDIGDKFSVVIVYYKEKWDTKWHWFGQYGGNLATYYNNIDTNWFRKVENGRLVTRKQSDLPLSANPAYISALADMQTIAIPDYWVPVLNTYVEPTKRGFLKIMNKYMRPGNDPLTQDWNFDSAVDDRNIYYELSNVGFSTVGSSMLAHALNVIKRRFAPRLGGWMAPFTDKILGGPNVGSSYYSDWTTEMIDWYLRLLAEDSLEEGHIGTTLGKQEYDKAKAAFDAVDPKIIINEQKTWLSVTNAEKQVDVWNRKLTP